MILKDKTAIISGVGNRFGRATAHLLAREGANVILISRKIGLIKTISDEIVENGGKAEGMVLDASNQSEVEIGMRKIVEKHGKIDILFNNAGGSYSKNKKLDELDELFWDEVIKNNLKTILIMSKSAINFMKKSGGGSIINISAAEKTILDGNLAYATAKGGVISLTKWLARYTRNENIKVNCIKPGVIREDFNLANLEVPPAQIHRKGNSEDVAFAALYFASNNSSWVTGQTLTVDGGESLFSEAEEGEDN